MYRLIIESKKTGSKFQAFGDGINKVPCPVCYATLGGKLSCEDHARCAECGAEVTDAIPQKNPATR